MININKNKKTFYIFIHFFPPYLLHFFLPFFIIFENNTILILKRIYFEIYEVFKGKENRKEGKNLFLPIL